MLTDDWHGLYGEGWKGEIVDEAFKHPAKFSRALVRRIYDHCRAEGWLAAGEAVCDPFGGVALGALDAMRLGLHWTGVELEQKFVDLGQANIAAWQTRYGPHMPAWGTARLVQGDSRQFAAIVDRAAASVSSPPYNDARQGWKTPDGAENIRYGDTPGQLSALPADQFNAAISSPPYANGSRQEGNDLHPERMEGTAHAPARYDAAISSPPFRHTEGGVRVTATSGPLADKRLFDRHGATNSNPAMQGYGDSDGQLANMPAARFEAAVSSPPFQGVVLHDGGPAHQGGGELHSDYGNSNGQLGTAAADDFWLAARAIVDQVYTVLAPGGHACWVVKDFVRNKAVVPFCDQWRQLCEAAGFVTVHCHRAWVVEHRGVQLATDGNHRAHVTERKSFFRRLAEKNGSPRIDWETVWCMEKPA